MRKFFVWVLLLGMLCMGLAAQAEATTYYVKQGGTGNGSSWDSPKGSALSNDLNSAVAGDVFYVAAGDYGLGANTAAANTFNLKQGVKLYGGFNPASTGTSLSDRNIAVFVTILSGDNTPRSASIVTGVTGATTTDTVLDGFTITGGNRSVGGGGMHNDGSSPTITNCTFSGNTADNGGGMYNDASSPIVTNCTFSGNTATGANGGGMYNITSSPTVVNTIFWWNTAAQGSAIYHGSGTLTLSYDVVVKSEVVAVGGTIMSADAGIFEGDPKIVSLDANLAVTTDKTKIYIYKLNTGSSAIAKGLAVGTVVSTDVSGAAKATVPATDQRGWIRPAGAADIGSYCTRATAPVTSIAITPSEAVSLAAGATKQLSATVAPNNAIQTVTWTSSAATVATVDSTGLVKAVAAGTATITATANDTSGIKATKEITVTGSSHTPIEQTPPPPAISAANTGATVLTTPAEVNHAVSSDVIRAEVLKLSAPAQAAFAAAVSLDTATGRYLASVLPTDAKKEKAEELLGNNEKILADSTIELPVFSVAITDPAKNKVIFSYTINNTKGFNASNLRMIKATTDGELYVMKQPAGQSKTLADGEFIVTNISGDTRLQGRQEAKDLAQYLVTICVADSSDKKIDFDERTNRVMDPAALVEITTTISPTPTQTPNYAPSNSGCSAFPIAPILLLAASLTTISIRRKK